MPNSLILGIFQLIILCLFSAGCHEPPKEEEENHVPPPKEFWVYQHEDFEGRDYTVFSLEKPINKGALPSNFLAIKNRKKESWNCLVKWEGDVLWFFTPSSKSFASHNSDNGKTQWTIIEEEDFNYFFHESEEEKFLRFSNDCSQPQVICSDSLEMHIVGDFY